jgi:alpha-glucosidase
VDGIVFETESEKLRLQEMAHGGIRVQAIREGEEFNDFSYAVSNANVKPINILIDEVDYFIISNTEFHVRVQKSPLRLSFETHKEEVINADESAFGISWDGDEVCNFKKINEGEIFTGMGEKTGPLNKNGKYFVHWNQDEFGYHGDTDPLYTSTPFYFAKNGDHWYGIFLDNTSKTHFNFGASNHRFSFFKCERGQLNYYFFHSKNPMDILKQYCHLTGFTPLPPKWSLGYQQCRYSYYPDTELLSLAQNFRDRKIPADVLYLDIHYMDAYKVFTWHPERFAKAKEMLAKLKEQGFKVVVIIDPGVKIEKGYNVMEEGLKKDVFLKYPDGENYIGEAWPGKIYFPDFTKEESRNWWSEYFGDMVDTGVEGFWNDMNEPAVWGKNVPDLVEFDYDGAKENHKLGHNVYGMQMARATHDGAKKSLKGRRPFVLTRSAFSGIQRYSAVWTGDNVSNDEHMFLGSRLITQLGLVGVPFNGNDIGGFIGESSIELFRRWIAVGAFSPFFRGHTMINSRDAEPWTFGEEAEEIAKNYISLRYRLMPYIYSCFHQHTVTGEPLNRALLLDFPTDNKVFDHEFQNQFLFGPSLLVCPIGSYDRLVKVYLPEGNWYDFFTDKMYTGEEVYIVECANDKVPIFVKEGAIIPMQNQVQNNVEQNDGVLRLHLYKSVKDSDFTLYEDDGETFEFQDGKYNERKFSFDSKNSLLSISASDGSYHSDYKRMKLYLHGFDLKTVKVENVDLKIEKEDFKYLDPISNFDPFADGADKSKVILDLTCVTMDLDSNGVEVRFY